jgi:2-oxoglutarate dehydrogenase E2 component (dihydrolipoamide succinyltransferase)
MIEVQMPQLGESVAEGTVTQWHVKEGDFVQREQPLLEVATDKADSEVPSPTAGVVVKIAVAEGDVVATGGLLCEIDDDVERPADASVEADDDDEEDEAERTQLEGTTPAPRGDGRRPPASPANRRLARERGIDLAQLRGSGERGRITREDVERAGGPPTAPPVPPSIPHISPSSARVAFEPPEVPKAKPRRSAGAAELADLMNAMPVPGVGFRSYKVPPFQQREGDEVIPFSRRRRITADHMVYSTAVAPHVVTVAEIDLFNVSKLREKHKREFEKDGVPLTFLAFVVAAIVKALREHPTLNARVLDDSYVVFKAINVGIAVDTPSGLLVAAIKDASELSMRGIAKSIDDLATRARDGKITADDLMGSTFTVSNPGRKGNLFGGAIISQPNVGILRIGEIKKRPVVITDKSGDDHIAIHPIMYSALSYDHRVVDGVEANAFLWRISDILSRAEVEI